MGFGTAVHHVGTALLLISTVLLIVVSISSPVVNHLSLLKVELPNRLRGNEVTFGSFGYCLLGDGYVFFPVLRSPA